MANIRVLDDAKVEKIIVKVRDFAETIGEVKLYPYQKPFFDRIVRSVLNNDSAELTALFARQSGKSQTTAQAIASLMILLPLLAKKFPELDLFKKGVWVGIFAPTNEQAITLFDRVYSCFTTDTAVDILTSPEFNIGIPAKGGTRGNLIKLPNGSFCRYQSANNRSNIESKTYHLICVDECQDVGSFKLRKCFAEGTGVWTPDGRIVPIEKVVADKLDVITPDGPETPIEYYDNGEQEVWRVTTNLGKTIEVTENHRFLVRRRIGNRQPKMDILANIEVGDTIAAPLEVPYFGTKWTYKEGLLTGLMLGDGCFTGRQPRFCGFEAVTNRFEQLLPNSCSFTKQPTKENGLVEGGVRGTDGKNHVTNFFKDLGLWGHKGIDKFIPDGGSKEFLRGVVEGLIETDGCVHVSPSKKQISFANISEKLARGLQETLLRFGIHASISKRKNTSSYGRNPHDLWHIVIKDSRSCCRFYEEFRLITKQEKLQTLYEVKSQKQSRLQATDTRRKHDPRFTFERVKKIERVGIKRTYCVNLNDNQLIVNSLFAANSIGPMGAAVNASVVLTGTPNIIIGHFYHAIEKNKQQDINTKSPKYRLHFEADRFEVEKHNPYYKKYMKKEFARLGEESDEYQMAYLLRWPKERGMMFTKGMLDKKCYNRSMPTKLEWKDSACIAGLDLGKNIDSTVLTILTANWDEPDEQGNVSKLLLDWLELEGDDWESQYEIVVDKLSHYNIETMIVDSSGVGNPITERYMYLLPEVNIAPFLFTTQSKNIGYTYLLQEVKAGRLMIPANSDVRETKKFRKFEFQMTNLAKIYTGKYLNPRATEEDGHDDYPDSLMLAVYGTFFDVMPEVDISDSNIFLGGRQTTDIWGRPYSRPRERKFGRY